MSEAILRARLQFVVDDPGAWNQARTGVDQLGKSFGQLRAEVTANTVAQAAFASALKTLKSIGRSVSDEFGQFELTLKRAQGVLGGMTPDLERMRRFALFSRETEFSANQLAQGMLELARAGSEGAETLRDIKTVADVATVAEYDLKRAAVAVANAQQAWGGPLISTRQLMDQFVNAANASTFELGNLIQAMGLAQGAAIAYDQTLTTTLASLSMLAPVTGANTKAGTAFAAALRAIGDAKKQLELKKLGINLIDPETGGFRQIPYVLADFIEKTSKMSTEGGAAITKKIFGERGTRDVAAIMRVMERGVVDVNGQFVRGRAAIDAWYRKIEQGKLSLSEQADLVRQSLPMRWAQLKANFQRMMIEVGEKLAPMIRTLISAFETLAGAVEFAFKSPLGHVLAFGGALATIGAAMAGIRYAATTLGLGSVFSALGAQSAAQLAAARASQAQQLSGGPGGMVPVMMGGGAAGGGAGYLAGGWMHMRNPLLDGRLIAWKDRLSQSAVAHSTVARVASVNGYAGTAAHMRAVSIGARAVSMGATVVGGLLSAVTSPLALLTAGLYAGAKAIDWWRSRVEKRKKKEEAYGLLAESFDNVGLALAEMYRNGGKISTYRAGQLENTPMLKWALGAAMSNIERMQSLPQEQRAALLATHGMKSEAQFAVASVASALKQRMIKEEIPRETQEMLMAKWEEIGGSLGAFRGQNLALTRARAGEAGVRYGDLGAKDDPARGLIVDLNRLGRDPMAQFAGAIEMGKLIGDSFFKYGLAGGWIAELVKAAMPEDKWTPEAVKTMQVAMIQAFVSELKDNGSVELKIDSAAKIIGATLKFSGQGGINRGT